MPEFIQEVYEPDDAANVRIKAGEQQARADQCYVKNNHVFESTTEDSTTQLFTRVILEFTGFKIV